MYEGHSIGVVVPAYNEAGLVGGVIETMPPYVDRVYVVDDRSTDGTWREILRYTDRRERATVADDEIDERTGTVADGGTSRVVPIRHDRNRGVGAAIKTGYGRARSDRMDVTAVMAGDGQMDPAQLDRLLDPIVSGRAAYAKGDRLRGRDRSSMSSWRLFGNGLLSFLTKVSSGYWRMMDPQNGYTAISLEALEAIDVEGLYDEYGFANDLLVVLNTHGFTVADVSMPAVYGEETSHIQYHSFVPGLSWLLCKRFCRRLYVRYLLEDFHPLAFMYGLGVLAGAATLAGLGAALGRRGGMDSSDALSALTVLTISAISILLAMTFDRQENTEEVIVE
ncbi:glycosyltransferase family 2 protein [Natrialbaceae archaeon A-gly3]